MSQGYKQFFNAAKKAKASAVKKPERPTPAPGPTEAEMVLKEVLLRKNQKRRQKKKPEIKFPLITSAFLGLGILLTAWGVFAPESLLKSFSKVEVGLFKIADAADDAAKSSAPKAGKEEKTAAEKASAQSSEQGVSAPSVQEEMSHFSRLRERKAELDLREQELNELESELHKQRKEIEARIAQLTKLRRDISSVLQDRVEIDQAKVGKLVDVYSNMKPSQAAGVLGKVNEDLAVEVLGRMKKKDAANILNLIEPAKARSLSEKFTGYKRR